MLGSIALPLVLTLAAPPAAPAVQKAMHTVEWSDPAGDVLPGNTSDGQRPGLDVVKLALASDGTRLTVTATLKGPFVGNFASDVVQLYIDTDLDAKTGAPMFWSKKPGFEYLARLGACIQYENGGKACSGGMTGSKVKGTYAVVTLGRFKADPFNPEQVVGAFTAQETPIKGAVVSASLAYKDLGVKPGQAIRIVARETDGPTDATADFPEVILTLK